MCIFKQYVGLPSRQVYAGGARRNSQGSAAFLQHPPRALTVPSICSRLQLMAILGNPAYKLEKEAMSAFTGVTIVAGAHQLGVELVVCGHVLLLKGSAGEQLLVHLASTSALARCCFVSFGCCRRFIFGCYHIFGDLAAGASQAGTRAAGTLTH